MKLKYYLRGLGIGIVLATMILVIYRLVNPISNEEVIRRAEELGMVTTEADATPLINPTTADSSETESSDTSETSEESSAEASSENNTDEEKTSTEAPTTEAPTTEVQTTTETPTTEAPTTTEATAVAYTITITNQMGSESVAYTLYNAGIISDAIAFDEYLINNGYEEIILSGTFTVTSDMSYEQIARKICGR